MQFQSASRRCFGTRLANASCYCSLGLNLECVMNGADKVTMYFGWKEIGLKNLFLNAQIFSTQMGFNDI